MSILIRLPLFHVSLRGGESCQPLTKHKRNTKSLLDGTLMEYSKVTARTENESTLNIVQLISAFTISGLCLMASMCKGKHDLI